MRTVFQRNNKIAQTRQQQHHPLPTIHHCCSVKGDSSRSSHCHANHVVAVVFFSQQHQPRVVLYHLVVAPTAHYMDLAIHWPHGDC